MAARTGCDPDEDLYPEVVAAAAVGALRVAVAHWQSAADDPSLSELLETAFDILAAGLTAPEPVLMTGASS